MTMADAPGWHADPECDDQERCWDGSGWTERVRPAAMGGSLGVPGHAPDLHRALSAATADIDAVEDRLSLLFDRTKGTDETDRTGASGSPAAPAPTSGRVDGVADAAFAELDAALAAEEADEHDQAGKGTAKAKRGLFRRQPKETPSDQS
jgi:Protein of unknown function (DUF2510)